MRNKTPPKLIAALYFAAVLLILKFWSGAALLYFSASIRWI